MDGYFLGRFGVADIWKGNLCNVLKRNRWRITETKQIVETHEYSQDVASLTDEGRKHVFKQHFEQLTKCQGFLKQSLTKKQRLELFSYKADYIVARGKQPYVEGEIVIKPVLESFVEIFEGEVFQKTVRDAITGVALSNNTITRRIESMGKDFRQQIYEDFCSTPYTALAIDESTNITSEAQLLMYGKFACGCRIAVELLCCLTLHSTTTGHDIFSAVDTFFTKNQFDWGCVVMCCNNGAPLMKERNIGFRGIFKENFLTSTSNTASFTGKLWLPKSFRLSSMKWCR